jgi:hypothetical protein
MLACETTLARTWQGFSYSAFVGTGPVGVVFVFVQPSAFRAPQQMLLFCEAYVTATIVSVLWRANHRVHNIQSSEPGADAGLQGLVSDEEGQQRKRRVPGGCLCSAGGRVSFGVARGRREASVFCLFQCAIYPCEFAANGGFASTALSSETPTRATSHDDGVVPTDRTAPVARRAERESRR